MAFNFAGTAAEAAVLFPLDDKVRLAGVNSATGVHLNVVLAPPPPDADVAAAVAAHPAVAGAANATLWEVTRFHVLAGLDNALGAIVPRDTGYTRLAYAFQLRDAVSARYLQINDAGGAGTADAGAATWLAVIVLTNADNKPTGELCNNGSSLLYVAPAVPSHAPPAPAAFSHCVAYDAGAGGVLSLLTAAEGRAGGSDVVLDGFPDDGSAPDPSSFGPQPLCVWVAACLATAPKLVWASTAATEHVRPPVNGDVLTFVSGSAAELKAVVARRDGTVAADTVPTPCAVTRWYAVPIAQNFSPTPLVNGVTMPLVLFNLWTPARADSVDSANGSNSADGVDSVDGVDNLARDWLVEDSVTGAVRVARGVGVWPAAGALVVAFLDGVGADAARMQPFLVWHADDATLLWASATNFDLFPLDGARIPPARAMLWYDPRRLLEGRGASSPPACCAPGHAWDGATAACTRCPDDTYAVALAPVCAPCPPDLVPDAERGACVMPLRHALLAPPNIAVVLLIVVLVVGMVALLAAGPRRTPAD